MELFLKIVNSYKPLMILVKRSILDVWPGSEYSTEAIKDYCSSIDWLQPS